MILRTLGIIHFIERRAQNLDLYSFTYFIQIFSQIANGSECMKVLE